MFSDIKRVLVRKKRQLQGLDAPTTRHPQRGMCFLRAPCTVLSFVSVEILTYGRS